MPQVTFSAVIQFLSTVFSREGNPKELISDHGSQFMSCEFEMFLQNRGIMHRTSSVYYPRANGEVERFNRTLKHALLTASLEGKGWKEFTREFLQAYRATPHSTTQRSPAELLHARPMRTKLHISGLQKLQHLQQPCAQNIVDRVKHMQKSSKTYTDRKRGATEVSFKQGSFVRVKRPGILPKLQSAFSKPLKVLQKTGPYTYKLSDGRTWNASHLTPFSYGKEESGVQELANFDYDCKMQTAPVTQPERQVRVRRAPVWARDYVMN